MMEITFAPDSVPTRRLPGLRPRPTRGYCQEVEEVDRSPVQEDRGSEFDHFPPRRKRLVRKSGEASNDPW